MIFFFTLTEAWFYGSVLINILFIVSFLERQRNTQEANKGPGGVCRRGAVQDVPFPCPSVQSFLDVCSSFWYHLGESLNCSFKCFIPRQAWRRALGAAMHCLPTPKVSRRALRIGAATPVRLELFFFVGVSASTSAVETKPPFPPRLKSHCFLLFWEFESFLAPGLT